MLVVILINFNSVVVFAQEDYVVTVGEDKTFTECNYHDVGFQNDPNNLLPWPDEREASSDGNIAQVSLSATPGHAGQGYAVLGVMFDWDLGDYAWEEVQDWPVTIIIDFSYQLEAYYTMWTGSANSGIGPVGLVPWYDWIGYETGNTGVHSQTISQVFTTTTDGRPLTVSESNNILISVFCQAHSAADLGAINRSSSEVTITRIKIEFEQPTTGNYNVTNTSTKSNEFQLWMDISIKNTAPGDTFNSNYSLSIKNSSDLSGNIQPIECEYEEAGKMPNSSRYKISFQIGDGKAPGSPAYFENGQVYIDDLNGPSYKISDLKNFSVYGTNFDIEKHAWSFSNGSWGNKATPPSDIYLTAATIVNHIPTDQRHQFWRGLGYFPVEEDNVNAVYSKGYCYGLANSAIANFNNQDQAWGTGNVNQWENDIETHWPDNASQAVTPFNPLPTDTITTLNKLSWNVDTAKKIMYYFACQNPPFGGGTNGVGADGDQPIKSSLDFIPKLKEGSPVSMSIYFPVGAHTVACTQLISYDFIDSNGTDNVREKYIIWDNNHPYPQLSPNDGPYLQWNVSNSSYNIPGDIFAIKMQDGTNDASSPYNYHLAKMSTYLPSGFGDPQNIYGFDQSAVQSKNLIAKANAETSSVTECPNTIEVEIIGGQVNAVSDKDTIAQITLVPNGDGSNGQAVIFSTCGGSFNLLYLPLGTAYRIDTTKLSAVPFLKVYVKIPQPDGTVEILNYENIHASTTDTTQAYFYAGVGNTDKVIHVVTTGGTYNPDYDELLQSQINSPSNFTGIYAFGSVHLTWSNPSQPNFAGVHIMRNQDAYPQSPTDGTFVYDGTGISVKDTSVVAGQAYYYTAWSYDSINYSDPVYCIVDTTLFAVYGKVSVSGGGGLPGAQIVLTDGQGNVVGVSESGPDGIYAVTNLQANSYTLTISDPSYSIDNPTQSISLIDSNIEMDFTATPVPTLTLLFDLPTLNVGDTITFPWAYRNIDNSNTVNIQINTSGQWQTLASNIPILNGQISWVVSGAVNDQNTIKISLGTDQTIYDEHTFTLTKNVLIGDINNNGIVDLVDAIICLQISAGNSPVGQQIYLPADANNDGKIGTEEAIYILEKVAGVRE